MHLVLYFLLFFGPVVSFAALRIPFTKPSLSKRYLEPQLDGPTPNRYLINAKIGTPPQALNWVIDTGSATFWSPTTDLSCASDDYVSIFDYHASSTYTVVNETWKQSYGNYSATIIGNWSMDTLVLDGAVITNVTMGAATNGTCGLRWGVFGLGFGINHSYPTFIQQGLQQNVFDRPLYSIWENSADATEGEIVFGGVDLAKYTGDLVSVNFQPDKNGKTSVYKIPWTKFGIIGADGTSTSLFPGNLSGVVGMIDTGNPSGMTLPPAVYANVLAALGAVYEDGKPYVACSLVNSPANFTYELGGQNGANIVIPVSAFVDSQDHAKLPFIAEDGTTFKGCHLGGVEPSAGSQEGFLALRWQQYVYMVWDLEQQVVALAQGTQGYHKHSNITDVSSGTDIPGATVSVSTSIQGYIGTSTSYVTPSMTSTVVKKATGFSCATPTVNLGVNACAKTASLTGTTSEASGIGTGVGLRAMMLNVSLILMMRLLSSYLPCL